MRGSEDAEERNEESRWEHWKLLSSLKTTVEGLLSASNPSVWSRYGGLQRLHRDVDKILSHGLKHTTVRCKQTHYWHFVWCVRYICPDLASHVEQFDHLKPEHSKDPIDPGDAYKAEHWLLHSLQNHCLTAQLQPLFRHRAHTRKFYNDDAFLLSDSHAHAMLQCLQAVEQNNPRLLSLTDTGRITHSKFLPAFERLKSQSLCQLPFPAHDRTGLSCTRSDPFISGLEVLGSSWSTSSGAVPKIALTQCTSPTLVQSKGLRSAQLNNGPELHTTGNVKQQKHHSSDTSSSDQETDAFLDIPSPISRRSSFSEGQQKRILYNKGHTRSLSDTRVDLIHCRGSEAGLYHAKTFGSFSPQSSETYPSSLYVDSDGTLFRKPTKGQSLISYLSEQDFGSCVDLERENAHFTISDSLIAAMELLRCNICEGDEVGHGNDDIQQLKERILLEGQQIPVPFVDSESWQASQHSFHLYNSFENSEARDLYDADVRNIRSSSSSSSFLSSGSISYSFLQSSSAEAVAMRLLKQFEGMKLPTASELDWLVQEHEVPQKLLPIPDSFPISPDDGQHAHVHKMHIRVRGTLDWAPPRPQIIFSIHPVLKKKLLVVKQNHRCAGCGILIEKGYMKRLRYCEYLGRYFCQCCHENARTVVPARVLRKWDFAKYPVSNFARDLLIKIARDPLFNPNDVNRGLYRKVKALESVRLLRVQLYSMKNLFKTCRLATMVLDLFDGVPTHLTEDLHLFSLTDLTAVRFGELAPKLRELLRLGFRHVADCMLCQAKGFVCEFCSNDRDVIFPFELNKCQRCEECKACYHKVCFRRSPECPRCRRRTERRERMARKKMEELEDGGDEVEVVQTAETGDTNLSCAS